MPYSKTLKREQQLEWEKCVKDLQDGKRKSLLQFVGFTLVILLAFSSVIYLTTLVPEVVHNYMGVGQ